jgi:hypothetical protein
VQYKGEKDVPVWYCNNISFTGVFKEVLKSLKYAMKFMDETKNRYTCFGDEFQKLQQDKWPVTHMVTYLKCVNTRENTVARVNAVTEFVMTYLSESVVEGDDMYLAYGRTKESLLFE